MQVGTQLDNISDMLQRERVGMKHFQVKRIMQMLEVGCTAAYVRDKMREGYNLTLDVSVIRKIRMRTVYKHIPWPWGDEHAAARRARLQAVRLASAAKPAIIDSQLEQGATTHVKSSNTPTKSEETNDQDKR